uniref:Uncharacterized protein n=1 Tax=Anguilla anguilla TaxID=7936 RepID=A0A0E9PBG8_ANGAN
MLETEPLMIQAKAEVKTTSGF